MRVSISRGELTRAGWNLKPGKNLLNSKTHESYETGWPAALGRDQELPRRAARRQSCAGDV